MHIPDVSIVLLSYNRVELTRHAVAQLLRTTGDFDFELLIVDNASSDGTRDYLATLIDPRVRVLQQEENRWFGGGNNAGLAECRGRYVLLTQNDMTFAPESIAILVGMYSLFPNAGCVGIGGGFINAAGNIFEVSDWWQSPIRQFDYMPVDFNSGCCMLLERAFIEAHGIRFDERYRLYWEDVDLSHQVTAAGRAVYMVNNRLVGTRHLRSATITPLLGIEMRERIRAESEAYYRTKWQTVLRDPARRVPAITYRRAFPGLRLVPTPVHERQLMPEGVEEPSTDAADVAPYEFLEMQGNDAAAINGYEALVRRNPANVMAYRNLCRALSRTGAAVSDSPDVVPAVTAFLRSRPPTAVRQELSAMVEEAVLSTADRLAREGRSAAALVHYREIHEIAQNARSIAICELQIAKMTYLLGDVEAAERRLRDWVLENETADLPATYQTSARFYLGEIAAGRGQVALAREYFTLVLAIDAAHGGAADRLAALSALPEEAPS